MTKKIVYRILFQSNQDVFELYAYGITESEVFGFIEIEELTFGESNQLVIDPSDEKLKATFSGVKRTLVPLHHIIRVDVLEKEGSGKVHPAPDNSNVRVFPTGMLRKEPPKKDH